LFDEMKKFLSFFALLTAASAAHAHDLTWVKVGDAGNAPDKTGHGAVAYEFEVTKHEITVSMYAEFLNAVATKADPHALWNAAQKIVRTGNPGAFKYAASPKREGEPVMQVRFLDAMRFANWLHHGGGPGDTETGAYLISKDGGLASREAGARIWIPNENEWYKAAYYQPQATGGPPGNYWRYPTRSNLAPKLGKPGDPGLNLANFLADTRPQPNGGILRGFNEVMPATTARSIRPGTPGNGSRRPFSTPSGSSAAAACAGAMKNSFPRSALPPVRPSATLTPDSASPAPCRRLATHRTSSPPLRNSLDEENLSPQHMALHRCTGFRISGGTRRQTGADV
jgi:hypothetical protein